MIKLTLLFAFCVLLLCGWLLVEFHQPGRRKLLAVVIPLLSATPFGFYLYGQTLMGYGVEEDLGSGWSLVHAAIDERHRVVYALVSRPGESEPRLYVITKNFEQNKRAFGKAQGQAAAGVPVHGKKITGPRGTVTSGEGDYVFYVLPPSQMMPKDEPQ